MKHFLLERPLLAACLAVCAALVGIVAVNILLITVRGQRVPVPDIPRQAEKYGPEQGSPLVYAVFGDSTTIAQGGDYDRGYVRASARYLADQGYRVTLHNFGISGARAADIPASQIPRARKQSFRPDVVLVAVTANDVTHLTSFSTVRSSLERSIADLRSINPSVQILVTGSPQMGTIPRFPQPTRYLAKLRTNQINAIVREIAVAKQVQFVPIADKTGALFAEHPEYYATDLFHPNNAGYATWTPVINEALDHVLEQQ